MVTLSVSFVTGNIGYGQTVSQTETLNEYSADLALDGVGYGTGYFGLNHCAATNEPPDVIAFWIVDLGRRHHILNVTIYKWQGRSILIVVLS